MFNLIRILLDTGVASAQYGAIGGSTFSVWVIIESILLVIGLNFTFLAMVNERNQLQYKRASLLDPLTSVWNRRALFQLAEKCRQHCLRNRQSFSVLLFDLDHFKAINDRFGHTQGDKTLINFCQIAQRHMPKEGWFARLGGEEFAAVMVAEKAQALAIAEHIRSETAGAQPDGINYTVSIGVACDKGSTLSVGDLMTEADDALYRAKARGRNCVVDARATDSNPAALTADAPG
ncbi:GGDEF domain-containing protein [Erwinia sp. OLCASP19]|uniref:GGDEF domain-containing protein n=1 Tax=Erwinia sp. OLCASP19 TaxID=1912594 RepID=UPI00315D9DD8